jgi:hypothetical protein
MIKNSTKGKHRIRSILKRFKKKARQRNGKLDPIPVDEILLAYVKNKEVINNIKEILEILDEKFIQYEEPDDFRYFAGGDSLNFEAITVNDVQIDEQIFTPEVWKTDETATEEYSKKLKKYLTNIKTVIRYTPNVYSALAIALASSNTKMNNELERGILISEVYQYSIQFHSSSIADIDRSINRIVQKYPFVELHHRHNGEAILIKTFGSETSKDTFVCKGFLINTKKLSRYSFFRLTGLEEFHSFSINAILKSVAHNNIERMSFKQAVRFIKNDIGDKVKTGVVSVILNYLIFAKILNKKREFLILREVLTPELFLNMIITATFGAYRNIGISTTSDNIREKILSNWRVLGELPYPYEKSMTAKLNRLREKNETK